MRRFEGCRPDTRRAPGSLNPAGVIVHASARAMTYGRAHKTIRRKLLERGAHVACKRVVRRRAAGTTGIHNMCGSGVGLKTRRNPASASLDRGPMWSMPTRKSVR